MARMPAAANGTPGVYSQVAGYGSSAAPLMQVKNPEGVAVDDAGNLYVADTGNNRVLLRLGGTSGAGSVLCGLSTSLTAPSMGQARAPEGVTICSASVLGGAMGTAALVIGDTQNHRIQGAFPATAPGGWQLVGTPNNGGTGPGQFRSPGKIR